MTERIRQAILAIIEQKRREGDVLPFATSIEVAHLLDISIHDVEKQAKNLHDVEKGKTSNYEYYYE